MTPLYGHTSPESAYLVTDYPYSFTLRTQIRYWLEFKAKKGFRFVSQTMNPKTLIWNAPKASTYTDYAACMFLDDQDHVKWTGVGGYTSPVDVLKFITECPGADMTLLRDFAKAAVNPKGLLAKFATGEARYVIRINGVEKERSRAEAERELDEAKERYSIWMRIAEKLGVS